jgi:hypothetical protein
MKLAIRAFALGLVLVGAVAANSMPKHNTFVSHQAVASSSPIAVCKPGTDSCGF